MSLAAEDLIDDLAGRLGSELGHQRALDLLAALPGDRHLSGAEHGLLGSVGLPRLAVWRPVGWRGLDPLNRIGCGELGPGGRQRGERLARGSLQGAGVFERLLRMLARSDPLIRAISRAGCSRLRLASRSRRSSSRSASFRRSSR